MAHCLNQAEKDLLGILDYILAYKEEIWANFIIYNSG